MTASKNITPSVSNGVLTLTNAKGDEKSTFSNKKLSPKEEVTLTINKLEGWTLSAFWRDSAVSQLYSPFTNNGSPDTELTFTFTGPQDGTTTIEFLVMAEQTDDDGNTKYAIDDPTLILSTAKGPGIVSTHEVAQTHRSNP